ncbi:MAG: hypothetical protein U5J96_00440 [Ignavibacteriaceae bacterium]|nr:hypothetical protein [Ignavibacteriaceae bacterium]
MGVQSSEGISIISLNTGNNYVIEKGFQFAIDDKNKFVTVAQEGQILIYNNSVLQATIQTGMNLPRKIIVSTEQNLVGLIDKFRIKVYSLANHKLLFEDKIGGDLSFRDLKIIDDQIRSRNS